MRSAACRRGRCAQELASGDLCSISLHHLISGRAFCSPVPTFRMHAARKPWGWDPSTKRPVDLAQGWHGHHPFRADRGRRRDA